MANNKNLASGTLVAGITTSSTTLTVYVGDGNSSTVQGVWPTAPFYATVMPSLPEAGVSNSLDSEIVQVTAVSSDQDNNTTLTVTRAQKNTTAKSFDAGAVVTNAIYTDEVAQASGTVGGSIVPVYVNSGQVTACNTFAAGSNWNMVPKVGGDGVMEIGRYIDFHNTSTGATDNTLRIDNYQQDCIMLSGLGGDVVIKNGATGTFSLRDICANGLKNGSDVLKVTAGQDSWSKDFDNIVFPRNFGAAVLASSGENIWANNPTGSTVGTEHWYLVQEQFNNNSNTYARQYCSAVNASDGGYIWYRKRNSGSWSAWQKVATDSDLSTIIGDLSDLTTTDKTDVVSAINEVDSALDDAAYVGSVLSTPTSVDYVATDNIQDDAVTSDKIDFTTLKNVLKPGDSLTITGDSIPNNVKYFAQWNDSQNKFDVLVPLNVLFSSDVSTLSVSFASSAVTYFPQGAGGSFLNVSFELISYSFDTGLCIRCTPTSTVSHTSADIFAIRLPVFTITAS